jgi:hypothetical protein
MIKYSHNIIGGVNVEKVTLTDQQIARIELLRSKGYSNRQIIANILPEVNTVGIQVIDIALEGLHEDFVSWWDEDFDKLIQALYVGYY